MPFTEAPYAQKLSLVRSISNGQTNNGSRIVPSDDLADVVDIYLQQAAAYYDESQWGKAIAACKKALEIAPETASAYKMLGNILQRQGKLTDAMGFYAEALTRQPSSPEIYSNLGSLYARKQDWEQAIAYFQKAIDRAPDFAMAYSNLAKVWKKLGKSDEELACLQTALQLQPEIGSAHSHYRIAQSLEEKGKAEAAITFYRQAIERATDFLPAYQRLVELLEDRGDWESALTYYRKVVELTAKSAVNLEPPLLPLEPVERANQPPTQQANAKIKLSERDQKYVRKLLQASSTKRRLNSNTHGNSQSPNPQVEAKIKLSERDQKYVRKLFQASSIKQRLQPVADRKISSQHVAVPQLSSLKPTTRPALEPTNEPIKQPVERVNRTAVGDRSERDALRPTLKTGRAPFTILGRLSKQSLGQLCSIASLQLFLHMPTSSSKPPWLGIEHFH